MAGSYRLGGEIYWPFGFLPLYSKGGASCNFMAILLMMFHEFSKSKRHIITFQLALQNMHCCGCKSPS